MDKTMIEQKDPPICRDCRHYSDGLESCYRPDIMIFNPVRGRTSRRASFMRRPGGECGPEAKLFEPIPPADRFETFMRMGLLVGLLGGFAWLIVR
jgi:hypothetical protein